MTKKQFMPLVKAYIARVKQAGIPVEKAIVFGSQAKGTSHTWSDIDVCVVSKTFGKNRLDERVTLMNLSDTTTELIEPHPYHPSGLSDAWDPLAREIRVSGLVV